MAPPEEPGCCTGRGCAIRATGGEVFDRRPVIGIATTWSELTPCNAHFDKLAEAVKRGAWQAGGFPLVFPVMATGETRLGPRFGSESERGSLTCGFVADSAHGGALGLACVASYPDGEDVFGCACGPDCVLTAQGFPAVGAHRLGA